MTKREAPTYKVHSKCPRGLPKVHSGKKWLELITDPNTPAFIEGVIVCGGHLCVLKYAGRGKVLAQPMRLLPDAQFSQGLGDGCLQRIEGYLSAYGAGEYTAALQDEHPTSGNYAF